MQNENSWWYSHHSLLTVDGSDGHPTAHSAPLRRVRHFGGRRHLRLRRQVLAAAVAATTAAGGTHVVKAGHDAGGAVAATARPVLAARIAVAATVATAVTGVMIAVAVVAVPATPVAAVAVAAVAGGATAGGIGVLPGTAELEHVPVEDVVVSKALLVEKVAEELSEVTARGNKEF